MTNLSEIKNSKDFLLNGGEINIETVDKDDLRIATICIHPIKKTIVIWFNGAIIHSCITFRSLITRIKQLDIDWDLELNWD
jgi:hypothetical protein